MELLDDPVSYTVCSSTLTRYQTNCQERIDDSTKNKSLPILQQNNCDTNQSLNGAKVSLLFLRTHQRPHL